MLQVKTIFGINLTIFYAVHYWNCISADVVWIHSIAWMPHSSLRTVF